MSLGGSARLLGSEEGTGRASSACVDSQALAGPQRGEGAVKLCSASDGHRAPGNQGLGGSGRRGPGRFPALPELHFCRVTGIPSESFACYQGLILGALPQKQTELINLLRDSLCAFPPTLTATLGRASAF